MLTCLIAAFRDFAAAMFYKTIPSKAHNCATFWVYDSPRLGGKTVFRKQSWGALGSALAKAADDP